MGSQRENDLHVLAPVHLLRLLEIYCSPARTSCPHTARSTGSVLALGELQSLGLVERDPSDQLDGEDHGWRVTGKGNAYCQALQRLPLPVQIWSVPVYPVSE